MPAFQAIAHLDLFDLTASLPKRMGLFKGAPPHRTIPIRGPSKNDPETIVFYEPANNWPVLHALIGEIDDLAGKLGVSLSRLSIEMLDPGASWRCPRHDQLAALAIRTNPDAHWYCRGEVATPQAGYLVGCADWFVAANYGGAPFMWVNLSWLALPSSVELG